MTDKDANGTVSVEEVAQILYLRTGKGLLDSQFEEIFGTEVDDDGDKCINWLEFQAMYRRCRNDSSGALINFPKTTFHVLTISSRI
mmetsp:Transcript_6623/g.26981  ORF Transcript_6623/g.26981 Transcript_6623/m.26981 type:complete len:86 (+) Transcript_6623:692-949(+)